MARVKNSSSSSSHKDIRTPINPENAEAQCISLAMDLVKQRLIDGTASSQEVTHFLKLGSQKAQLEMEKMRLEQELTRAKTEQINADRRYDEEFKEVLAAMMDYQGRDDSDEYY